jgi:hypothetical protein
LRKQHPTWTGLQQKGRFNLTTKITKIRKDKDKKKILVPACQPSGRFLRALRGEKSFCHNMHKNYYLN